MSPLALKLLVLERKNKFWIQSLKIEKSQILKWDNLDLKGTSELNQGTESTKIVFNMTDSNGQSLLLGRFTDHWQNYY